MQEKIALRGFSVQSLPGTQPKRPTPDTHDVHAEAVSRSMDHPCDGEISQLGDNNKNNQGEIEKIVAAALVDDSLPSIDSLLDASVFFIDIGNAYRAKELAAVSLSKAKTLKNQNLIRRAHNVAVVAYTQTCNFESAFRHAEAALTLAREIRDPVAIFATMCNVVATFKVMGLSKDARELSAKLLTYPSDSGILEYLHLQNAINGMLLSAASNDAASLKLFYDTAQEKLVSSGVKSGPWLAYIASQRASFALSQGRGNDALEEIRRCVAAEGDRENLRVSVILHCMQGRGVIALNDKEGIRKTRKKLESILTKTKDFLDHHEEVLRMLVDLYASDISSKNKKIGRKYMRELSEYLVSVKHRQFFLNIQDQAYSPFLLRIRAPYYKIPKSFFAASKAGRNAGTHLEASVDGVADTRLKSLSFSQNERLRRIERKIRSVAFNTAEDWAVAADFAADGSGDHSFKVSELCKVIALTAGFTEEDAVLLSMACRLHDIGKVAVAEAVLRSARAGTSDEYRLICEHTAAGQRLLGSVDEDVFKVAASVAESHHEWWNGCGAPHGLRGEDIAIEARICCVANAYIKLKDHGLNWSEDDIARQLESMAGVQLDPSLIKPLFVAVNSLSGPDPGPAFASNTLRMARTRLLGSLQYL